MKQRILDMCCGSRMFYFDKQDPQVLFTDIREYHGTLCDGRKLDVQPDMIADCTNLPFEDETFNMVVFDPPHLLKVGQNSWLCKKYGRLPENWQAFINDSIHEGMRVLKTNGTLIFKWNEQQIKVSDHRLQTYIRAPYHHQEPNYLDGIHEINNPQSPPSYHSRVGISFCNETIYYLINTTN